MALKRNGCGRDSSRHELGDYVNVLVLYTGGTIGMRRSEDGLIPSSNMADFLKENPVFHDAKYQTNARERKPDVGHQKGIKKLVMPLSEYGVRVIYYIKEYEVKKDSSNMRMKDWVDIAQDVENNYDKFDSFIILHGTDTMSYTASALSFMFENLGKSVILTGSQIPIFEPRSDGMNNLLGALTIAGHFKIPEVTLFFDGNLYRGNRTTKVSSSNFSAFDSPSLPPLATMNVKIYVRYDALFRSDDSTGSEKFRVQKHLNPNIRLLKLHPEISNEYVMRAVQSPTEGVVLETYGAGNSPAYLVKTLKSAIARGVIFVNCTQCLNGAVVDSYETGKVLFDIGVLSGSDMTSEAAFTKLSWVLGNTDTILPLKKKQMETNLRGEMTVAKDDYGFAVGIPFRCNQS